ncbi:MAG TPA: acyl-ACP--UDP-N-acetylglucosamine O-acyltransferase [Bryobacteraceae bacterium]|nr:acyl-ACP--UDP-N-acetylglucosamine O-acyltransferase [Bryobacteraceae bacterium]
MPIHPTAIVDPGAAIDGSADIGPYCIIGASVTVGAGTRLMSHVVMEGRATVGSDNTFFPFSTVGVAPQDLKYSGEPSETVIGDRNSIREFVAIHRGTRGGGMVTRIGSDNLLQAYSHVAHDCVVGSHVMLGHSVTLAGHVTIQDWAWVGAFSGVHQFCRVGRHSMIGGYSVITQDVLPYATTVSARENKIFGANRTGLERRGFEAQAIESLQKALRLLSGGKLNTSQAVERIRQELPATAELEELLEFIATSQRGFVK